MTKSYFTTITGFLFAFMLVQCSNSKGESLYVNATSAFENFNLTQELKLQTSSEDSKFTVVLDSLKLALELNHNSASEEFRRMSFRYDEIERARENHISNLIEESDEKIWSHLNRYFKKFGKDRKCLVLLGGTGNGSVLYVDDTIDVTEEFIEFANRKYEGE